MPQNFGQTLQPDQLQALVSYLQTATGGGATGGGGGATGAAARSRPWR